MVKALEGREKEVYHRGMIFCCKVSFLRYGNLVLEQGCPKK
jgi:hypothetical protein